ncbi:bis(5'-nucleosyl)-tetraphosphatase PrpE [asymmetrical]-like [Argiope bruennichi]|uniref:Bis(5'-nucleosyl)-tetraphosphatase like protein n=1 Tax=Argiope bruennichi TaxID=94029 RepID=A0A8T0F7W3_ARGBR|nr:bis(5'-nucleosyl)-tetraphosphatase PrpE [asymmetrical]-like [Argiope bruennichi]KAF8787267.1 Bis(5'-nucleosyl)-tetraphosphatase like protein [Argiope bruennichi]
MGLIKLRIIAFIVLQCIIIGVVPRIFEDQKCQADTPEGHFRPSVPHLTLTEDYLNQFKEIIIIGDQHGCYDEEQLLINRFQLNDTVLKIFTGDLTRKGNKNLEVIRYVKNCSSCISVRGNNDEKTLLMIWKKQTGSNYTYAPADKWMKDLTEDEINWLKELPYSIYLPSMNSRVCHGGFLPGGIPIEDNRPYTIMNIRTVIADPECPGGWRPTRQEFLDSKETPTFPWASQWRGPEHIFFGHDHSRQLQLYPFATGVDTACVRGHYMTGLFIRGPRKGTFATQPALKKYYHGKV